MTASPADPARRVRGATARLRAWCAILADPDRHPLRERSTGWLALALLISFAAHLALLTMLDAIPRRYGGDLRLALRASLVPAPEAERLDAEAPRAALPPPLDGANPDPAPAPPVRTDRVPPGTVAGSNPPLVLPERYFRREELDTPAMPLGRVPLIYPQGALHLGVRGTVRLRIYIGADGAVRSAEVVSVVPEGHHFDVAALEAIRMMRYAPALKDAQAVPSQKLVEVEFDPDEPRPPRPAG